MRLRRLKSVAELSHAALVGGYGVGGGGDGAADDDVVGADLLGSGGGHDTLLVANVAVSETDAGGDGPTRSHVQVPSRTSLTKSQLIS